MQRRKFFFCILALTIPFSNHFYLHAFSFSLGNLHIYAKNRVIILLSVIPPAMLCSVSTGKSGPNWLDRLRTAKGFPENAVSDLENFLQNPNSPTPVRPEPKPKPKPRSDPIGDPNPNEDKQLLNIMSDVLGELFNFGEKCSNPTKLKKSARKQSNPRICTVSVNESHDSKNAASEKPTLLRSGDSNSGVEGVNELCKLENEGEAAERDGNLTGFSRTEVTVIDTSYEMWKFEKLLYRKKNVWKVRDKKGKSDILGNRKKRKMSGNKEVDHHAAKKSKVDKDKVYEEKCALQSNRVFHQNNKPEANEKAPDEVRGALKKKHADLNNFENGSASVILIKSIHIGKKTGSSISKSSLKSKQKRT